MGTTREASGMALEKEFALYTKKLLELAADEGKYVLVHADEIVDVYGTYEGAMKEGLRKFGQDSFLVQQIQPAQPAQFTSKLADPNCRGSLSDDDCGSPFHRLIAGFMACAPGVERVLVSADGAATHVWSIVNNLPRDGVYHLYAREDLLLDRFPEVPIDFHVVDRRDAPAESLIPGAETVFAK
jgi:hypothetical protein